MAFYWSYLASQYFDVRRKDFWQMFFHHINALVLMAFMYAISMLRLGSLVILVHDFSIIFLMAAKIFKYANYQKLCYITFVVFIVVWCTSRLGFYPRLLYSATVEAPRIFPMFPAFFIINILLGLLLVLHILWTYAILKALIKAVKFGQVCL
jgi:sphingoid base N-palmitoyltransferase